MVIKKKMEYGIFTNMMVTFLLFLELKPGYESLDQIDTISEV